MDTDYTGPDRKPCPRCMGRKWISSDKEMNNRTMTIKFGYKPCPDCSGKVREK